MAIEDAAVLSRCLEGVDRDGVEDAFRRFEATRKQAPDVAYSIELPHQHLARDPDWVYGYDAWNAPHRGSRRRVISRP